MAAALMIQMSLSLPDQGPEVSACFSDWLIPELSHWGSQSSCKRTLFTRELNTKLLYFKCLYEGLCRIKSGHYIIKLIPGDGDGPMSRGS